jgi:hypothetical protein
MKWKTFALLESSFCVLLSVLAVILLGFILVADGSVGGVLVAGWLGIVLSAALTLVAHGQLIGSFRRRGSVSIPQVGSAWIPTLVVAVIADTVGLLAIGGDARWVAFAQVFLSYALLPPAALAMLSRVFVARSIRRLITAGH